MKSSDPFISFVLPAYKNSFLKYAIESILNQSYTNFELIIVNDASPYDLRSIVESFTDDRICYFVNERNLGGKHLTDSWNHALSYAKGEYVVLASDDDVYSPDYLYNMVELSRKYPQVNIFHCRLRYIDVDGSFLHYSQPALEYEKCSDFVFQRLVFGRKQAAPEFMFKKTAIDLIGGFINFPLGWYSDDATWNALASKGVAYSYQPLLSFRLSGENLSSKHIGNIQKIEALFCYERWLRQYLSKMVPMDNDDEIIINTMKRSMHDILSGHLLSYLPYISFGNFCRVIRRAVSVGVLTRRYAWGLLRKRVFMI